MRHTGIGISLVAAAALLVGTAGSSRAIDTIILTGNKAHEGTFEGYQNGRFHFQPTGDKLMQLPRTQVKSLILEPPAKVITKERSKKKQSGMIFVQYEGSEFFFKRLDEEIKISGMNLTHIEMDLDMQRTGHTEIAKLISDGDTVAIEDHIQEGVATIVHFHSKAVTSSIRQGTYVSTLTRDSKGDVVLLKIDVPGWDSPVARQYGITSAPQFWFYNKEKKLVRKLIDRFTEADISGALKEAQK